MTNPSLQTIIGYVEIGKPNFTSTMGWYPRAVPINTIPVREIVAGDAGDRSVTSNIRLERGGKTFIG